MKTGTDLLVLAGVCACIAGCGLQKNKQATRLDSADFVADPTTTPTQASAGRPGDSDQGEVEPMAVEGPAASVGPEPPPIQAPAIGASDGAFDLSVTAGGPELQGTAPDATSGPVLVEAKVGEINGRAVRVQEVLDVLGGRLDAAARTRRLTVQDWALLRMGNQDREITRQEWLAWTERLLGLYLNQIMEDELLEAEARASLKPEQQMGLRYMVQEFGEQQRREAGGSQAALSRRLSERGRTLEQAKREREMILLIQYQLEEKIRKRVRVSWKDVRLWYERNFEVFNPPATARFRMIQVRPDNAEGLARVDAALASGKKFEEVASGEDNIFDPGKGGYWGEKTFQGEYAQAQLFSEPLNATATSLAPGKWAGPIDFSGAKTWLYLESVDQVSRPLSDRDVQLRIANDLNREAFTREQGRYIDRLKVRASFSDMDEMTRRLTEVAARRYWPE